MHHWQDFVFSLGSIIFVIALFPSVKSKDKPALSTSLTTGSVLAIFALTYLTLQLWFSSFTTLLTSLEWFLLGVQKYTQDRKPSKELQ
jgi:hypothetical protein